MPSVPKSMPWSSGAAPDLLTQAATVLAREAMRIPGAVLGSAGQAGQVTGPVTDLTSGVTALQGKTCPIVGASLPMSGAKPDLRQQAHELLAGLFALFGQNAPGLHAAGAPWERALPGVPSPGAGYADQAGQACPVTHASLPQPSFDKDALRRRAHEFIDSLLVTFRDETDEDGMVAENKVPLIECVAPTAPGEVARASLDVTNEESSASDVTLHSSGFIGDSGYEIPALRASFSPRAVSVAPGARARFEIKIAVPAQTPAGNYSGLIQALGTKYVKAVLSIKVL